MSNIMEKKIDLFYYDMNTLLKDYKFKVLDKKKVIINI